LRARTTEAEREEERKKYLSLAVGPLDDHDDSDVFKRRLPKLSVREGRKLRWIVYP